MSAASERVRFDLDERGEWLFGLAPGIDRKHLLRLKRGEPEVERELDLHGLERRAAREAVRRVLREAHAAAERCVRIVHGRGLRSEGGPVLKEALPEWLAEPPVGAWIMAFASAPSELGGPGATLVLLRRARRRA